MIEKIGYKRIGNHLLFWGLFLIYQLTSATTAKNLIGDYWWGDWKILHLLVVGTLLKALFAYGFVYFIVPRYLDEKKYIAFGVLSLIWIYVVSAIHVALYYYYFENIYTVYLWNWGEDVKVPMYQRLTNIGFLLHTFSTFTFPAIILGAIKFYKKKMMLSKVEEEKNKMELKALKNQLNPHFLFNTLNNLYSFVVTGSSKAPDMILRLSGILDYVLYKSQNAIVPLKDEVETIEHFIGLEKIRYGDRLKVNYQTEGNMTTGVSPLILLSIVENAFKHGASGDIDSPEIKIKIKDEMEVIYCEVWNTKSKEQGELNDAYKEGIGLSNIKRQLDLLYPKRNNLVIDEKENSFNISLTLNPKI